MREIARNAVLVACAIIGSVAPEMPAEETGFDVALDFSTAANPNGAWSYGFATSLGDRLTLYTEMGSDSGFDFWRTNMFGGAPVVEHNSSSNTIHWSTAVLAPGQAAFHPGVNGDYSVFRFTTPGSGPYRLESSFFGSDIVGTTTDVHVLLNNLPIFNGTVSGFGANTGPAFNTNLVLQLGDQVDFAVGTGNGSFLYDTTGIQARLIRDSPRLVIRQLANVQAEIAWSQVHTNYFLESADTLLTAVWWPVTNAVAVNGDSFVVNVGAVSPQRYFRLHKR